jgi:hypothetical protein
MTKRKVTRKCFNEGVVGLIEYNRKVKKKITTREEAERELLKEVVVVEAGEMFREATEEFKPDFGLLGLKPEEAKVANKETGNTDPKTMTNEDWSNLFDRSNRNGR